ncbi:chloride channel protein [Streptomyces genisteinicus]|uniref:Chloride channel protein n=1 Tax=Streptomyces genisteinicus TaxID=2768068 RepID=A0A7H0HV42_9ACTN|nr:chloride channel protein [Streptomyces genisteinicus]QNP64408.1 chloride channel protein [Streptomyces genisteinicus]
MTPPAEASTLRRTVISRGYLRLLLLSVLLGAPISLACFFFVGFQHELQHWVWESLPEALGHDRAPWWWPLPALTLAGLIAAPIITRTPGAGGHVPVHGLGGDPIGPKQLPGTALVALTTLPLGVVLGPEAPLMAVGSALALLAVRALRATPDPKASLVIATTGSTAAIATILGNPLVAAIMVIEAAGLAGAQMVALLLPCLLASAAGALVFTGFGNWTGLTIGALSLPTVPPDVDPDAGDFLWGVPAAVLIGVLLTAGRGLGRRVLTWTGRQTAVRTVACAVAAGGCIAVYALVTGRSPEEAALSGQATLAVLAEDPHAWPVSALIALVVFKGVAWGICLGSLRGGPIFPSVLLGAAVGIACAGLPGLGVTAGLALGVAAAAAVVTGLPLTAAVLALLLLGPGAHSQTPLIVIASVTAFLTGQLLARRDAATKES